MRRYSGWCETMITTYLAALRVYQWPKNLVVFAALIFAEQLHHSHQVLLSVGAFFTLCAASSAVYLLNDMLDVARDRTHPEKRDRPLASGAMGMGTAAVLLLALAAASLVGAYRLRPVFCSAVAIYLALMTAYSVILKRVMLVDVIVVALGFVVRAVAGALVLQVEFSNWLVVCTLFLALFLSLGKRRHEIELMDKEAAGHREVLGEYSVPFLDGLMLVVGGAALLTYTIYTCSPEVVERLGDKLYVTIPFVIYGLFRYIHLVHMRNSGGDPSKTLLKDVPIMVTVLLWGLVSVGLIYWHSSG
jgi:4-hydroxybenzoate polyprenyltransferase